MTFGRVGLVLSLLVVAGVCSAEGPQPKPEPLPADVPPTAASLYRLLFEVGQGISYPELTNRLPDPDAISGPAEVLAACKRLGLEAAHRKANWSEVLALETPFLAWNCEGEWLVYRVAEEVPGKLERLDPGETSPVLVSGADFLRDWSHDLIVVSAPPIAAQDRPVQPRIQFSATEHDFGKIWQKSIVEHWFTFENVGSAMLEITAVKPGCGCTEVIIGRFKTAAATGEADIEWKQRKFGPGDAGVAKIVYDAGLRRGDTKTYANIETNDRTTSRIQLWVKAHVQVAVEVVPMTATFGPVCASSSPSREIRITATDDPAFEVLNATATNPRIQLEIGTLELPESASKEAGWLLRISLDLEGMKIGEQVYDNVVVRTSSERRPTVEIPVRAKVSPAVYASPNTLTLVRRSPGRAPTGYLVVIASGEQEVKIVEIQNEIPGLVLEMESLDRGRYRIKATLDGGDKPVERKITIITDHPEQSRVEVPVRYQPPRSR